jgi:hypothetical protein
MKMKLALAIIIAFTGAVYADIFPISPLGPDASSAGLAGFATSLILTIIVELAVSVIYLYYRNLPKEILSSVVVANIVSVPLVFLIALVFPLWDMYLVLLLIEFGVFMLEAAIIFSMNKKKITSSEAITLSFFNNLASFIAGVIIMSTLFVPPNRMQTQCTFPVDLYCTGYFIKENGTLTLVLMQETGHPITVTGFNCTSADNPSGVTSPITPVNINSDSRQIVVNGTYCYRTNGDVATGRVGNYYNGKIYINYTEEDTGVQRISAGSIKTRYEP